MDISRSVSRRLLRTKPIEVTIAGEAGKPRPLARSITLFQLTMLGVGCTIGTGIFVILGDAVPKAGPGVVLSFALAGITAALTALCFAELAAAMPVAGSSYSYAYATMGELVAYLVGSCLVLEYGVSASTIAVGWGQYINELSVDLFDWRLPREIANPPGVDGGILNLPAAIAVFLGGLLLIRGARESAGANAALVVAKILVLVMFIAIGFSAFSSANLHPFMPSGFVGVGGAASSIFFSFIGIDAISTAGEEAKNPKRDLPLAIIFSLVIITAVYVLVSLAAVGAQPVGDFNDTEASLAQILRQITGATWPSVILSVGAIISIFSSMLVCFYGQTRILCIMARDGLVPQFLARVDPRTQTPVRNTVVVGLILAVTAAMFPLDVLADLTSLGTLVAFMVVSLAVIILRRKRPDLSQGGFRVPFYPMTPLLSAGFCLYLIAGLPAQTFVLFGFWVAATLLLYACFGWRRPVLSA